LAKSTNHEAPRYAIFSILPSSPHPSSVQYPPQHPVLKHPQSMFLPQCQRPSFTPIQNTVIIKHIILDFVSCISINKMYSLIKNRSKK
jgi:hypothetical protein